VKGKTMSGGNLANRLQTKEKGNINSYPVAASAQIYHGAMVALIGGYAGHSTDTAARPYVGMAMENVDNTAGDAGDKRVRVYRGHIQLFEIAAGQTLTVGEFVTISAAQSASVDQTIKTATGAYQSIGRIVMLGEGKYAGHAWVQIDPAAMADVAAAVASHVADAADAHQATAIGTTGAETVQEVLTALQAQKSVPKLTAVAADVTLTEANMRLGTIALNTSEASKSVTLPTPEGDDFVCKIANLEDSTESVEILAGAAGDVGSLSGDLTHTTSSSIDLAAGDWIELAWITDEWVLVASSIASV
jgi:hypothetical protein